MENKILYSGIGGTLTIGVIILLTVLLTGEELTCKSNSPYGWEIDNQTVIGNITIYYAHCPYKTKEWLYAICYDFRATGSYERYGCAEILINKTRVPSNRMVARNGKDIYCGVDGCNQYDLLKLI